MNIGTHVSFQIRDSSENMPRKGTAGSHRNSIFSCLKASILFSIVDASIYNSSNNVRGFHFLHTLSSIYYLYFLMMSLLTSGRWYFFVVLICISLITSDTEHLFMCLLAICMSPLEKCLFRLSIHFLIWIAFLKYWVAWFVCVFWKLSPCQLHCLQIFSPNL